MNVNEAPKRGMPIGNPLGFMIFKTLTASNLLAALLIQERNNKMKDRIMLSGIKTGAYIGNVFQDPRSQFFASNVTDEIVLAMENRNYAHDLMERRLEEFGEMLGITELFDKDLLQLSSGEKQKVAVAAACVIKPKILVFVRI